MLDCVLLPVIQPPHPTACSAVGRVVLLLGVKEVEELRPPPGNNNNPGVDGPAASRVLVAKLLEPRVVLGDRLVVPGVRQVGGGVFDALWFVRLEGAGGHLVDAVGTHNPVVPPALRIRVQLEANLVCFVA